MIRQFFSDWVEWSLRTAWWNLRFQMGWVILPGERKRISIYDAEPTDET